MKRKSSRLLCCLAALIMTLATTGTAFAAGNSVDGVEAVMENITVNSVTDVVKADTLLNDAANATAQSDITVTYMKTGSEEPAVSTITYDATNNLLVGKSGCMGYSKQVWLEKGTVTMVASAFNATKTGKAYYGVFTDQMMTSPVDSFGIASEAYGADTEVFWIPASGNYWVGAYTYTYDATDKCVVTLGVMNFSDSDRDVYSGQPIAVGQEKSGQVNYFKFKATATGYLNAVGSADNSYYMTLLDSKKKALSDKSKYSGAQDVWGVKKGKSYYIKVEALYSSYDTGAYVFQVENKKVSEKSGAKKAKAVTIKKGKTKEGTIVAGENKADWYKFKLTKKKKVKLTMKGATNDELRIVVYKGNKKITTTGTLYPSFTDGQYSCPTVKMTLQPGTYHIKVFRGNKKSSGYYTLKWK